VSPPAGYTKTATVTLSPAVLQWVPPVALFLVLILSFFAWDGYHPGDVPVISQSGWTALWGGYTTEPYTELISPIEEWKTRNESKGEKDRGPDPRPGWSVLTLFYLVLLIPTLVVAGACVALPFMKNVKLPTQVDQILPWRWGIVTALSAILLLFLCLQLLVGFSLETNLTAWKDHQIAQRKAARSKTAGSDTRLKEEKRDDAERGMFVDSLRRTFWLKFTVVLQLLALICAALMFWIGQRGEGRPLPRFDFMS
jgi:ABC-type sugar transport system permease subunit